ncbi:MULTISPECIES: hypothetical protein [unclassified Siphonobacter]|uniref:hypothetical protein n=1 Tax=unclassified Siphonobacter TaxID=2635712 RepID=UPI000CAAC50E|nr:MULTISPECIES: hypothetical protein [unclassified Siphonobacter]MDQ1088403.1 hypothetical protein [Siphonobacter sp. SORGH_AS_1065]MDR6194544.1 hypothetical protein [Siphonobacter sp. SORGH_AS_0500]PKK37823.1 hypothetical protein BWI96_05005 [Siphonobacter sp. SORGH_AS_0500]
MRKYALLLGFLLIGTFLHAQTPFYVKVGVGPSIPYGKFEDSDTQELAELVNIGPNYGLTLGHDFSPHFGIALTGTYWTHSVKQAQMTEYLRNRYLPAGYAPLVSELRATAENFRFASAYLSPYYTFELGCRFRVDLRLNGGLLFVKFPGIVGEGRAVFPLDNNTYDLRVSTPQVSSQALMYGVGGSLHYELTPTVKLFVDVDGLRSRPVFDDIPIQATLGPVSLNTARPAFTQTAGTLSARLGVGLFF